MHIKLTSKLEVVIERPYGEIYKCVIETKPGETIDQAARRYQRKLPRGYKLCTYYSIE